MRHGESVQPGVGQERAGRDYVYMTQPKAPGRGHFQGLGKTPEERYENALKIHEWVAKQMAHRGRSSDDLYVNESIPSGYTYLGQFITHDITFIQQELPVHGTVEIPLKNFVTPTLDLDSIYRGGPKQTPSLYALEVDDENPNKIAFSNRNKFRLGKTSNKSPNGIYESSDIPRMFLNDGKSNSDDIKALMDAAYPKQIFESIIGDPRNEDNLILTQMCLLFYKFHNLMVEIIDEEFKELTPLRKFSIARNLTIFTYHNIIRNDFLKKMIPTSIRHHYEQKTKISQFQFAKHFFGKGKRAGIPVEFSLGAMRVGHAMVRQTYKFNNRLGNLPTPIAKLMSFRSNNSLSETPLTANWTVNWALFFDLKQFDQNLPTFEPSRKIQMAIAEDLSSKSDLFPSDDKIDSKNTRGGLAFRDFARGLGNKLLVAQVFSKKFSNIKIDILKEKDIKKFLDENLNHKKIDSKLNIDKNKRNKYIELLSKKTPLFMYLLMEAELGKSKGKKLGELGGVIFSEVFYAMLLKSEIEITDDFDKIKNKIEKTIKLPNSMPSLIKLVEDIHID